MMPTPYVWEFTHNGEELRGSEIANWTHTGLFGPMQHPTVMTEDGRCFKAGYVWDDMGDKRVWHEVKEALMS